MAKSRTKKKMLIPKGTITLTLGDLGILIPGDDDGSLSDEYWVEVWDDPSKPAILSMLRLVVASGEEITENKEEAEELYTKFLRAASQIFIDTNIAGLDFSDEEAVEACFSAEELPWGFMYEVCTAYVLWAMQRNERLKKALGLSNAMLSSGTDSDNEELTSQNQQDEE